MVSGISGVGRRVFLWSLMLLLFSSLVKIYLLRKKTLVMTYKIMIYIYLAIRAMRSIPTSPVSFSIIWYGQRYLITWRNFAFSFCSCLFACFWRLCTPGFLVRVDVLAAQLLSSWRGGICSVILCVEVEADILPVQSSFCCFPSPCQLLGGMSPWL